MQIEPKRARAGGGAHPRKTRGNTGIEALQFEMSVTRVFESGALSPISA